MNKTRALGLAIALLAAPLAAQAEDKISYNFVDAAYMSQVTGLSFESAATVHESSFQVRIDRIIVHGLGGSASLQPAPRLREPAPRIRRSEGSAAHWPAHEELR